MYKMKRGSDATGRPRPRPARAPHPLVSLVLGSPVGAGLRCSIYVPSDETVSMLVAVTLFAAVGSRARRDECVADDTKVLALFPEGRPQYDAFFAGECGK